MKQLLAIALLALCASCTLCRADTIVTTLPVNQFGFLNSYDPNSPYLYAYGRTLNGGYSYFGAWDGVRGNGRYNAGFLDLYASGIELQGQLSKISFNSGTGLFQAFFVGKLIEDGRVLHIWHSELCEQVSLRSKSVGQGYLVISTTVPEPGTWGLMAVGVLGLLFSRKYRAGRVHSGALPSVS